MHDLQTAGGAALTRSATAYGIALVLLTVDQVSKGLAVARLTDREPIELIGPVLKLNLTYNPGAAFSTGTSWTVAISIFAAVAAVVVTGLVLRTTSRSWAIVLGVLLGGILGNLGDRLFRDPGPWRGHVVDFLQLPNWPIFNLADIYINLAAISIIVLSIRHVAFREPSTDSGRPVDAS